MVTLADFHTLLGHWLCHTKKKKRDIFHMPNNSPVFHKSLKFYLDVKMMVEVVLTNILQTLLLWLMIGVLGTISNTWTLLHHTPLTPVKCERTLWWQCVDDAGLAVRKVCASIFSCVAANRRNISFKLLNDALILNFPNPLHLSTNYPDWGVVGWWGVGLTWQRQASDSF